MNDLWSYSIETNEWTWVSGNNTNNILGNYGTKGESSPDNYPGGRFSSISWTDELNYNLWLFGGIVFNSAGNRYRNDLWSFNIECI